MKNYYVVPTLRMVTVSAHTVILVGSVVDVQLGSNDGNGPGTFDASAKQADGSLWSDEE